MKTFDEILNGKLVVSISGWANKENSECATVMGLPAARAWLDQRGGFAALRASHNGPQLRGWDIYRAYPGYGQRCCGSIEPAN